MPTNIASLKSIKLNYTQRGPGLNLGYSQALAALDVDRTGFLRLDAVFSTGTVPVIMRRDDLYLLGFQSADGWWRFSDADWPLVPAATSMGFDGNYQSLGGMTGSLTVGAMNGVGKLSDPQYRSQWKEHLRTLLIVVAENLRLIPVQMAVLGILNEINDNIPLASIERYIRKWGKASEGMDMSVQSGHSLRTGFRNPTIQRR